MPIVSKAKRLSSSCILETEFRTVHIFFPSSLSFFLHYVKTGSTRMYRQEKFPYQRLSALRFLSEAVEIDSTFHGPSTATEQLES